MDSKTTKLWNSNFLANNPFPGTYLKIEVDSDGKIINIGFGC